MRIAVYSSNDKILTNLRKNITDAVVTRCKLQDISDSVYDVSFVDIGDSSIRKDFNSIIEELHSQKSVIIVISEDFDGTAALRREYELVIDSFIHYSVTENIMIDTLIKLLQSIILERQEGVNLNLKNIIDLHSPDIIHNDLVINILNYTNEGLWVWDLLTDSICVSPKFLCNINCNRKTSFKKIQDFIKRIHPADKQTFKTKVADYIAENKKEFCLELRLKCDDDTYRWFLYRGYGVFDKNNSPVKIVGIQADINQMKSEMLKYENMALYDALTELPNRTLLYDRLHTGMATSVRSGKSLGLLFVDLDDFKSINDNYGHKAGDFVLKEAAFRLNTCIRKIDTVARLAGDEFVVVLPNLTRDEDIDIVIERIKSEFEKTVDVNGLEIAISGSIGISIFPQDGDTIEGLMEKADKSMYKVKGKKNKQR